MIPDEIVQEVKRRVDLGAVVGRYVQLKRSGRSLIGLCPFHAEKTPSFNVRTDEGFYKCFGCDAKGDVFRFLAQQTGQDFHAIVRQLAAEVGVEIPDDDATPAELARRAERKRTLRVLELAQLYFRGRLRADEGASARAYLRDVRGLDEAQADVFGLGFGGMSDEGLKSFLGREGVSSEHAVAAGVLAEGRNGPYDFFRQRITFPVRGRAGEVLSFSARAFGPSEKGRPKYVNGPSTSVYDKSRALYGLFEALPALKKGEAAVLVEGQLDVIATHRVGVPTGLAVSGTSLTDRHVAELQKQTERVIVALDADAAGQAASERAILMFLQAGLDVAWAKLVEKDPDAMVQAGESEALKTALAGAASAIEVLVERAVEKAAGSMRARALAVDALLPFLAAPPRELLRHQYTRLAARALNEDEQLLWREVEGRGRELLRRRLSGGRHEPQARPPAAPQRPHERGPEAEQSGQLADPSALPRRPRVDVRWTDAERSLARALMTHPDLAPRVNPLLDALKNHELRGWVRRLIQALVDYEHTDAAEVLQKVPISRGTLAEIAAEIFRRGGFAQPEEIISRRSAIAILNDYTSRFDSRTLEEQLAEVQRAINVASERDDLETWRRLQLQAGAIVSSIRSRQGRELPPPSTGPQLPAARPTPGPGAAADVTPGSALDDAARAQPVSDGIPAIHVDSAEDGEWDEMDAEWDPM